LAEHLEFRCRPHQRPEQEVLDYLTGSSFIDDLAVGDWALDSDRLLRIPDYPGVGVEPDLETLRQFTSNESV
jgi:D-galactarolactone cycloisomerase